MPTYSEMLTIYLDRADVWEGIPKSPKERGDERVDDVLEQQHDLDASFGGTFGPAGLLETAPGVLDFRPTEICWLWRGNCTRGRPRMRVKGKLVYVHRYVFERAYGPLPPKTVVMHRCNQLRCVRPNHLLLMPRNAPFRLAAAKARQTKETSEAEFDSEEEASQLDQTKAVKAAERTRMDSSRREVS